MMGAQGCDSDAFRAGWLARTLTTYRRMTMWVCLLLTVLILLVGLSDSPAQLSDKRPVSQSPLTTNHALAPPKGVDWNNVGAFWQTGPDRYNWDGIASDLADMRRAQITWARLDLRYGPPLTFYDKLVSLARSYRIHLLFIVHKAPPEDDLGTTSQQLRSDQWLVSIVDRYKDDVKTWECLNEPNLPGFWNINVAASDAAYNLSAYKYVLYLEQCYQTIKGQDPTATVLLGGLSEAHSQRFLQQLLVDKAYRYFDGLSFHPYAQDPTAVIDTVDTLRLFVARDPRFRAKSIWITEVGFQHEPNWTRIPSFVPSEQQKAEYLTQTMEQLRRDGVTEPIFWYTLHEGSVVNGFGLERKDPATLQTTYLPAFYAYQHLWSG